jgi:hypothetical protein
MSPEIGIWGQNHDGFAMPIPVAKKLMTGAHGIFDPKNFGMYFQDDVIGVNFTKIMDYWGMDRAQDGNFTAFCYEGLVDLSDKRLHLIFKQGGGLIATESVHDWLWDRQDPLLQFLQPDKKTTDNINNNMTVEDALKKTPSVYWTGKGDPGKIGWYIEWEGKEFVDDVATHPMPVTCTDEWGKSFCLCPRRVSCRVCIDPSPFLLSW